MTSPSTAPPPDRFATLLLKWYRTSGRDLPWRQTRDPYAIWLSEIMLQQTQVTTVIPYYRRFLDVFPTVHALAEATLDEVLKQWEGLGYYARARHLHRSAQIVVAQFGGAVPSTFDRLHALPGIGRSTAGAILSLAFGQRYPILDGNVRRVLCRYFGVRQHPKLVESKLWEYAERLLPERKADLYTQALMDLGATVCVPRAPRCLDCPVSEGCVGYRKGIQGNLPARRRRKPLPHHHHVTVVVLVEGQPGPAVWIRQRPAEGLLGGLWEFPSIRADEGDVKGAAATLLDDVCDPGGITLHPAWQIAHAFTHFTMTLHVFVAPTAAGHVRRLSPDVVPVAVSDLPDYPFSASQRRIALKLSERLQRERRDRASDER